MITSPTQQNLAESNRWYSYSGLKQGDISVPAVIELTNIPNVGLKDCYIQVQPYFGLPNSTGASQGLGIQIQVDEQIVYEFKGPDPFYRNIPESINLFIPRQSAIKILSLNTSGNNSQSRGCTVLGWYL